MQRDELRKREMSERFDPPLAQRQPVDANQAVSRIVFERSYERFRQLYPNFAKVTHERLACFAYPLGGGFERPSVLPLLSIDLLLRFEQCCRRFGRLPAFRLLGVLEKTSSDSCHESKTS